MVFLQFGYCSLFIFSTLFILTSLEARHYMQHTLGEWRLSSIALRWSIYTNCLNFFCKVICFLFSPFIHLFKCIFILIWTLTLFWILDYNPVPLYFVAHIGTFFKWPLCPMDNSLSLWDAILGAVSCYEVGDSRGASHSTLHVRQAHFVFLFLKHGIIYFTLLLLIEKKMLMRTKVWVVGVLFDAVLLLGSLRWQRRKCMCIYQTICTYL